MLTRAANLRRRAKDCCLLLRCSHWLLVALLLFCANAATGNGNAPAAAYMVHIDGTINPGSTELLQHAITTASKAQAAALVVRLDTPGGLLSSTRDMVSAITEAPLPVVVYVGPAGASATSAGAFILLAADIAVMNTGTNVGASSPVAGDGSDIQGTMAKKVMNDSRAFMRSIANQRGRNADAAERFVSEAESVTALEALENNLIDLVVSDFANLLPALDDREMIFAGEPRRLNLNEGAAIEVEPRLIDRLLGTIAHPQIAHLLISLGMLAIYIEILSPGLTLPGIFGAVAMVLGLVGVQTLPVNVGFLLLLFLGAGLMISEYFVAGFGLLGIGGAVAFTLGSLNLFDVPLGNDYRSGVLSVSIAVCGAILVTSLLISRSVFSSGAKTKNLVGRRGEAMVSFERSGYVLVDEQRRPAQSDTPLRHGDAVVVVGQQKDGQLQVKKA